MDRIALALLVLAAGCGTAPELAPSERLDPLPCCFARAPLADVPTEPRTYRTPLDPDVLRTLLPADAWSSSTALVGDDGALRVLQTPEAHDRIARIVRGLDAQPWRAGVSLRVLTIPRATAESLGPLATAAGARERNPFLMVPLGPSALERLEALVAERKARLESRADGAGPPGQWITCRSVSKSVAVGGVAWTSSARFAVDLETRRAGCAARVALAPLGPGEGLLLAFRIHERARLEAGSLTARAYGDNTTVAVELPDIIERRAEDTVFLAPGVALGFLGATGDRDRVRLVVLAPVPGR